ncbi:MAG TPA: glycosyltransferase 87 family protein [Candidatus Limnocylindrales bacterium]|nr:glycosyltransferase 87 family protein [Candidatus Limnocylindrales bacterium]
MRATRGRFAIALAAFGAAVLALAVTGWPARTYIDSDFMQYYAGSHALIERASPYDQTWWNDFHRRSGSIVATGAPHTGDPATDWTTPYPLWVFLLLVPFALVPLAVAAPLFALTQIALVLAATFALATVVLRQSPGRVPFAVVSVAASQPLWALTYGGNVTGFAAAGLTAALAALLTGRAFLAGVLLAGCLLKPHLFLVAAIAMVFAARSDQRRPLAIGAIGSALVLLAISFALDPGWVPGWLRAASRLQETSFSNASGWTILRPVTTQFVGPSAAIVIACVAALAVWWRRTRPTPLRAVAAALPVSVLLAPHAWSYDYIVLVPVVVWGFLVASVARVPALASLAVVVFAVALPWILNVVAFARNGEDLSAWLLVAAEVLLITVVPRRATVVP